MIAERCKSDPSAENASDDIETAIAAIRMIPNLRKAACLSHAARQWLPMARTGKPAHPSVLSRWSDRGVLAANGQRVYLETWRVGGQRMTTQAAIEAFLSALNADSETARQDAESNATRRSIEAGAALEKLGC